MRFGPTVPTFRQISSARIAGRQHGATDTPSIGATHWCIARWKGARGIAQMARCVHC